MIYAVSGCLLGRNCKYNGGNNSNDKVVDFCRDKKYAVICPETSGGLEAPRSPAEIVGGDGKAVLRGAAKVVSRDGKDVTREFLTGAKVSLDHMIHAAEDGEEIVAVLKARSPSCGSGTIYDGSFSGVLVEGDGVTAALFKSKGIKVLSELDLLEAAE